LPWTRKVAALHLGQDLHHATSAERRFAGQQRVQGRAKAVDIAGRSDRVITACRLLRAHESRRAKHVARQGRVVVVFRRGVRQAVPAREFDLAGDAQPLGKAPIDDERLTVVTQNDVRRLQVAMDHTATVGIRDGVAHRHEAAQELPQGQAAARFRRRMKFGDGLLEGLSPDEAHRVTRLVIGVPRQPIHRHDAWVLQAPCNLPFAQEAAATAGVAGVSPAHALEGDFARQLLVPGQVNLAQPPAGVQP
jgi:hypothetical protein